MAPAASVSWRGPLGWLVGLVLVADAVLAVACLYFLLKAASYFLALGILAVGAGLDLLAVGLLLANLVRRQWHRALAWLAFMFFCLGSSWFGWSLFFFVIAGHLGDSPPPPG